MNWSRSTGVIARSDTVLQSGYFGGVTPGHAFCGALVLYPGVFPPCSEPIFSHMCYPFVLSLAKCGVCFRIRCHNAFVISAEACQNSDAIIELLELAEIQ